ncbi:GNAT family N-acetyltransferase [Truepera radiovictrix]|uniref:GCN5-related N-acetyltransferase n=1 Tax=Truepera radiovictrix (strain DSM 17093 / CIP 108686 / LMG 22925 / RQ-24) TaxID=649638 RepID=D7CXU6_TRURR|nr:GNAT family N-acetyltransferase [Truepera radiovictrix]ADI13306.1 GCN5-related N-acetyltransferase [Truepera radiovictrix DSM 17093]WMT58130.1 GNAT family N-acetyltransferase [Truepera radiovictrix]
MDAKPQPAPGFSLRSYHPEDLGAVYRICLETGDTGEDATHLYRDPELLGHLYAGPYVTLEPELAFVLEDAAGVCGYVLGARDSSAFYARLEAEWFPPLRARYPEPEGDPDTWTRDEHLITHLYTAPPQDEALFGRYPSHLHIDLLKRAQGRGNGRALMAALFAALRAQGSPGVHLGTSPQNVRAERFYRKLGFRELKREPPYTLVMGRGL